MAQYYYTDGKERFGPFSPEELKAKNITRETLVWTDGLSDWLPAGNVTELQSLFTYSGTNLPPSVLHMILEWKSHPRTIWWNPSW